MTTRVHWELSPLIMVTKLSLVLELPLGRMGAAQVGDVIRFGSAFGGTTGFAGDAVITSIASTISLRIEFYRWIEWWRDY